MEIIYGTSNKHKVEDMSRVFKEYNVHANLERLSDIGFDREIIEDGTTFKENSEIKARAIEAFCKEKGITGRIIITDDAGLCINHLNGEPGVYSARYAGENATQEESVNLILDKMKEATDRSCKFVCVLTAIVLDSGEKIVARGECLGSIAKEHGVLKGLTYSPIFVPEGCDRPMSEMNPEEYVAVHNHRDQAMKKIIEEFKSRGFVNL